MKNLFTALLVVAALTQLPWSTARAQAAEDFDVLFNCDMQVQILIGFFDEANDTLDVRGSFNGWSGPADILVEDPFTPNLYQVIKRINLVPMQDTIEYKFVITNNTAPGTHWENIDNRRWGPSGNEPDLNGDGTKDAILDTVFWSEIGPDDIFTTDTPIVFEVDTRPAHAFIADSGAITFGGGNVTSIDTVYLAGGAPNTTPTLVWVWDQPPGDPLREALQMNDQGTNGDLVAGDSIWSMTLTFHPGAAKILEWKHGIAGFDNEAGFAQNYREDVSVAGGRVRKCFGSNGVGGSGWYDPYQSLCGLVGIFPIDIPGVARTFQVSQNYPNPFNPSTTIEYVLTQRADVRLVIYNTLGEQVRVLASGTQEAGNHQVVWDGLNAQGQAVSSGVYLYHFSAGDFSVTKKMMLLK